MGEAVLVQHGDGVSGLDLVQAEGEGEAAGQLLDAAERRGGAVEAVAQLRQHLVEQLEGKPCQQRSVITHKQQQRDWRSEACQLTCCRLRMSVLAHWILSICRVLLIVSFMMSP